MTMLLLKTREEHMAGVRKNRMHATDAAPQRVSHGDWLLVQVTSGPPTNEVRRVKYAMRFDECYRDEARDSERIWGHRWEFIVRGYDFRILRRPFDIEQLQVSNANYGQGVIRFAYIHPDDEREILARQLLEAA